MASTGLARMAALVGFMIENHPSSPAAPTMPASAVREIGGIGDLVRPRLTPTNGGNAALVYLSGQPLDLCRRRSR